MYVCVCVKYYTVLYSTIIYYNIAMCIILMQACVNKLCKLCNWLLVYALVYYYVYCVHCTLYTSVHCTQYVCTQVNLVQCMLYTIHCVLMYYSTSLSK